MELQIREFTEEFSKEGVVQALKMPASLAHNFLKNKKMRVFQFCLKKGANAYFFEKIKDIKIKGTYST